MNLANLSLGDIAGLKTVVSFSLIVTEILQWKENNVVQCVEKHTFTS